MYIVDHMQVAGRLNDACSTKPYTSDNASSTDLWSIYVPHCWFCVSLCLNGVVGLALLANEPWRNLCLLNMEKCRLSTSAVLMLLTCGWISRTHEWNYLMTACFQTWIHAETWAMRRFSRNCWWSLTVSLLLTAAQHVQNISCSCVSLLQSIYYLPTSVSYCTSYGGFIDSMFRLVWSK
jgi:hypothetical protein